LATRAIPEYPIALIPFALAWVSATALNIAAEVLRKASASHGPLKFLRLIENNCFLDT
jgi:hypothetical protein